MRKTVNVLWLDDNEQKNFVSLQKNMNEVLKEKGYLSKFITVDTVEAARNTINRKQERIDFFVSDFNLGGESNSDGIDFLVSLRTQKIIRQFFILYSNTSKRSLWDSLMNKAKNNKKVLDSLIVNFGYFSIGDNYTTNLIKREFSKLIDIALNRWEELSALRGEYAAINTLGDSVLERIFLNLNVAINKPTYEKRINKLKYLLGRKILNVTLDQLEIDAIFNSWHYSRKIRNSLEHNTEQWDAIKDDYFILYTPDNSRIYESQGSDYRKMLISQISDIKKLLINLINNNRSLNFLLSNEDYNVLINN